MGGRTLARVSPPAPEASAAPRWHSPAPDPERARVLALLERHGRASTGFQLVERGFRYWFDPQTDAVVGYVEAAGHRVVAGRPVAAEADLPAVTARFVAEARGAGLRVAFFGAEADLRAALCAADLPHDALQVAEQPDWDPRSYTLEGAARRSLRAQVNRARNKGVRVRRIEPDDLAHHPGSIRAEIETVLDRWLASRRMSVMRFMVDLEPFTFPEARRYYVAERGDRPVGFLAAVPVYARRGWFFEDVIRVPDAPNGTAELLIHTALEDARDRGDAYVTLGMAPLAGVDTAPGPHRLLRRGLRFCYDRLGPLYHFAGVRSFKARFRPDAWTPQYLIASPGPVGLRTLHAVLSAFAGGGLVGFAVDTLHRLLERVRPVIWARALAALAALLVPWTVLLAAADGDRWFGHATIQTAWVAFDVVMVVALSGLAALARRDHPATSRLALLLGGATLADLVLSTVQALHLHRAATGWTALFVTAGLCGPALATTLLIALAWGRTRRGLHSPRR